MTTLHVRDHRGRTHHGWLDSRHTFSFGGFRDPEREGFRALRVLNEDVVIPGAGFSEHEHAGVDILTLVLSGELLHRDSAGHEGTVRAGQLQHVWAGGGVSHEELNPSPSAPTHFLQCWLLPTDGTCAAGAPTYAQRDLDWEAAEARWGDAVAGITLHSDTQLRMRRLGEGATAHVEVTKGRSGFVQVLNGVVDADGEELRGGDGLQIDGAMTHRLRGVTRADVIWFDLA